MKRMILPVLALCMLLCACGGPADTTLPSTDSTSTTASSDAATTSTTKPAQEGTAAPSDETTAPADALYRSPLTGEALNALWTGNATAVVINNLEAAMPQRGISQADILYEIEAEGGITRCLGIFSDLSSVGELGPIRSARTYFNNIAQSYSAPLVHCGGSTYAVNAQYDDSGAQIRSWKHIDAMYTSYFYRDQDRYNQGYAYEHTLFTTGEKLVKALSDKGYDAANDKGTDYGLSFAEELTLNGKAASTVTVRFRGSKTTTMTYNAETGLYDAAQYKSNWIDENNGETTAYRNVLVLCTQQRFIETSTFYDLIGSGDGYFACGAELVPIKWARKSLSDPFTYTLADGTPLTLGVGRTYVSITSAATPVEYR